MTVVEAFPRSPIAADVLRGLSCPHKSLPPYLFYDAAGSALYERITELPEYYPTRTERAILAVHADDVVRRMRAGTTRPLTVVELGAGTATKTQLILEAVVRAQASCRFLAVDVSASALCEAASRLSRELPEVVVERFVGHHEASFPVIRELGSPTLVLFIGSSIGNFDEAEAHALLAGTRAALRPGDGLLLGTDLRKSPERLVPAYDDAAGVTAAFNKNVLTRINRELGGRFEVETFRHVALWNDEASRIEMHLESLCAQSVPIEHLGLTVHFERGERIHTESSRKYDTGRVDAMLASAGFGREVTYTDDASLFAVHLARAV
ncbi:MAG: L-histidine N(alpha)-methyltransferase [Polyangiaceae bacterium]